MEGDNFGVRTRMINEYIEEKREDDSAEGKSGMIKIHVEGKTRMINEHIERKMEMLKRNQE